MTRLTVDLSPPEHAALKAIATSEGRSMVKQAERIIRAAIAVVPGRDEARE